MSDGFWAGRRVFVTGHTGFKGSWLSLWLAQSGARVAGYSNGVPTQPSLYEAATVEDVLESTTGDVRDREQLTRAIAAFRPDTVFHLAAQPLVRRSLVDPVDTFETNVVGTVNVLEAVRSTDSVRAVVVVTTDKVYEPHGRHPYQEDDPLGGTDPYSSSKACAELVSVAYRDSYFGSDGAPSLATVRAGNVIGGGDWGHDRLVPDLVAGLVSGTAVQVRYPQSVRPWQHVLNVVDGYVVLAERMSEDRSLARAWNFGPDRTDAMSVAELSERFGELWGATLELVAPGEEQPHEAPRLELDSSQARALLGWEPRWDLDRGLRATVEWYREFAAGGSARTLTVEQIDAFGGREGADARPAGLQAPR
jgi:CDP-glucose 4,6-dehydratase